MSFAQTIKKRLLIDVKEDFDVLALGLFRYQAKHNPVYKSFIRHLGINANEVQLLQQIPFMPIEFFKTQRVLCDHISTINKTFESSGTTGSNTSKHHVADLSFYLKNAQRIFEQKYGSVSSHTVLALLPSYLERDNSSLVAMANDFITKSKSSLSGFFLDDFEKLKDTLTICRDTRQKTILLGVTFGLLDFSDQFSIDLDDRITVMETGGMKGRRKELTRSAVHDQLKTRLGVDVIHSEYGMTELLSQLYSSGNGKFTNSDSMRVYLREISDPLNVDNNLKRGGINVIDLANVDSCAFIATQDMGRFNPDGSLEILGRLDNSDVRGCNLLL